MYIIPSFWNTVGQYEVIDTVRYSCVFIYLSDKVTIQGCINNRYLVLWTKEFFSHILIKQSRKYSGSNKYECTLSEACCLLYCACCFTRNQRVNQTMAEMKYLSRGPWATSLTLITYSYHVNFCIPYYTFIYET